MVIEMSTKKLQLIIKNCSTKNTKFYEKTKIKIG